MPVSGLDARLHSPLTCAIHPVSPAMMDPGSSQANTEGKKKKSQVITSSQSDFNWKIKTSSELLSGHILSGCKWPVSSKTLVSSAISAPAWLILTGCTIFSTFFFFF